MIGATFSQSHYDLYKETGNKNLFEEVIDKLVMDEHLDLEQDVKDYIMSEDIREDKRIFILSNILKEKSLEIVNSFTKLRDCETRTEHLNEALLTLNKYIEVGQQEVKKYGEVFTPLSLVKEMVATLPEEVWSNPNLKWLDPANGMGNFPLIVIYKLMKGLKTWEPNPEKRYKHIIENMIYVCELQPRNAFMYLSLVDPKDDLDVNLYCGSFLDEGFDNHMKQVWDIEKFDIVLGNPPYQEMDGGGTGSSAKALYNRFMDKSINISSIILMVMPSRWMAGGKGLNQFRKKLLFSNKVKQIKDFKNSDDIFVGTSISGGVCYLLWDNNYNGYCKFNDELNLRNLGEFDVLLRDKLQVDIVKKVIKKTDKFLSKIVLPRNPFKVSDFSNSGVDVFTRSGWFKTDKFEDRFNITNKYKVLISKADGAAYNYGRIISKYKILDPGQISSETYLICGYFDNKEESINYGEYLRTKFCRFMLLTRLISQNNSSDKFNFVPDMIKYDKKYSDEMLYEYFNLTQEEIDLIENTVK
jgi:site-specific DNA-methyltransferase (adenine-specific)